MVDTSFLFTLLHPEDKRHEDCRKIVKRPELKFVFPEVILGETTFLMRRLGGVQAVAHFLGKFVAISLTIISLQTWDLLRAKDIMLQYLTSELDFVDCCLMATSERLTITHICTLDRRDFTIFRPNHCEYLELLPE